MWVLRDSNGAIVQASAFEQPAPWETIDNNDPELLAFLSPQAAEPVSDAGHPFAATVPCVFYVGELTSYDGVAKIAPVSRVEDHETGETVLTFLTEATTATAKAEVLGGGAGKFAGSTVLGACVKITGDRSGKTVSLSLRFADLKAFPVANGTTGFEVRSTSAGNVELWRLGQAGTAVESLLSLSELPEVIGVKWSEGGTVTLIHGDGTEETAVGTSYQPYSKWRDRALVVESLISQYDSANDGSALTLTYDTSASTGAGIVQADGAPTAAMRDLNSGLTLLQLAERTARNETTWMGLPAGDATAGASWWEYDGVVYSDSAGATITLPNDANIPRGSLRLRTTGAGAVTFAGATGVSVQSLGGALTTAGQFAEVLVTKIDDGAYHLSGDLTT